MGPIALSFDITDALPADVSEGKRITIAAWLFFPDDPALLGERATTMVLINGGSYDKRYFHVEIPGRGGYSHAEYLASRGNIVLVPDHLGMGESTRVPTQRKATRHIVALANHAAVTQFYERLAAGTLHPHLPAIAHFTCVGGGHSMGGMQTVVQQGQHRTYDALMILGYTAISVHFTRHGKYIDAAPFAPAEGSTPDYTSNDRAAIRTHFHWEDVPADVIAADDAIAVETPAQIGHDSIRAGIIVADAATIDVPIYFGLGERDSSPDPHAEAALFKNCRDFTLHIIPRSGHCHSFASTRHLMWERMHIWSRSIAIERAL